MKNLLLLLTFLSVLSACTSSNEVEIIIENHSGQDLDSLRVYPNPNGEYVNLKNGDSLIYTADLSQERSDGAYRIVYRNTGTGLISRDTFGYYSNGMPLEREIRYRIPAPRPIKKDHIAVDLLIEDLQVMNNWRYSDEIDIDSLADRIGTVLVDLLTDGPLPELDTLENVSITKVPDGSITVYNCSYYSGGSAGDIYYPVIQWNKNDGTYGAYPLYATERSSFFGLELPLSAIHRLPATDLDLYLLIGRKNGDLQFDIGQALIIQIKNDYLILDYPGFMGQSSVFAFFDDPESGKGDCPACLEYSGDGGTLSIHGLGPEDLVGTTANRHSITRPLEWKDEELILSFDKAQFIVDNIPMDN